MLQPAILNVLQIWVTVIIMVPAIVIIMEGKTIFKHIFARIKTTRIVRYRGMQYVNQALQGEKFSI